MQKKSEVNTQHKDMAHTRIITVNNGKSTTKKSASEKARQGVGHARTKNNNKNIDTDTAKQPNRISRINSFQMKYMCNIIIS